MVFPGADPFSVSSAPVYCQTAESMAGRTISPSTSGHYSRKQRLVQFATMGIPITFGVIINRKTSLKIRLKNMGSLKLLRKDWR